MTWHTAGLFILTALHSMYECLLECLVYYFIYCMKATCLSCVEILNHFFCIKIIFSAYPWQWTTLFGLKNWLFNKPILTRISIFTCKNDTLFYVCNNLMQQCYLYHTFDNLIYIKWRKFNKLSVTRYFSPNLSMYFLNFNNKAKTFLVYPWII